MSTKTVFISYAQDSDAPEHAELVAQLGAALRRDGVEVLLDQLRAADDGTPWPIWMENCIQRADHVLLVCTDLYLRKVRQEVDPSTGRGVLWEINLIYNNLYVRKLNTSKFVPVYFGAANARFVPEVLTGTPHQFCIDVAEHRSYQRLYAFLTGQDRPIFPALGAEIAVAPREIRPLFAPPIAGIPAATVAPARPLASSRSLKRESTVATRAEVRGLDWYDEADASHFRGRQPDAQTTAALLLSNPIVRVLGPSGVGKSSLIRAGVVPLLRECGWRSVVVRPFGRPDPLLAQQLHGALVESGPPLVSPSEGSRLLDQLTELVAQDATIKRLVLVLDQFEDVVAPGIDPTALDCVRALLTAIWERRDATPKICAVAIYRTDADARLGPLWQEISGRPEGLPYLALQGLTTSVVEEILRDAERTWDWHLDVPRPELAEQLLRESQKIDGLVGVYPVYLQILMRRIASAGGRLDAAAMERGGGVGGMVESFLESTLQRLEQRGGDWTRAAAVLQALSRASGTKANMELGRLAIETGLSRPALAAMLAVMIDERLVRAVGDERYEIQHDRLAAAVIARMSDSERETKEVRELLDIKSRIFERKNVLLSQNEIEQCFKARRATPLDTRQLKLLHASFLSHLSVATRPGDPRFFNARTRLGWFWMREATPAQWLSIWREADARADNRTRLKSGLLERFLPAGEMLAEIPRLLADPSARWRLLGLALLQRATPRPPVDLDVLARDTDERVRIAVVRVAASAAEGVGRTLLLRLSEDPAAEVALAAVEELATLSPADASVASLRLAQAEPAVRERAVDVLASLSGQPVDTAALTHWIHDGDPGVRYAALRACRLRGVQLDTTRLVPRNDDSARVGLELAQARLQSADGVARATQMLEELARRGEDGATVLLDAHVQAAELTDWLGLLRSGVHDPISLARAVRIDPTQAVESFRAWARSRELDDSDVVLTLEKLRPCAPDLRNPFFAVLAEIGGATGREASLVMATDDAARASVMMQAILRASPDEVPELRERLCGMGDEGLAAEASLPPLDTLALRLARAQALRTRDRARFAQEMRAVLLDARPDTRTRRAAVDLLMQTSDSDALERFVDAEGGRLDYSTLAAIDFALYAPTWLRDEITPGA